MKPFVRPGAAGTPARHPSGTEKELVPCCPRSGSRSSLRGEKTIGIGQAQVTDIENLGIATRFRGAKAGHGVLAHQYWQACIRGERQPSLGGVTGDRIADDTASGSKVENKSTTITYGIARDRGNPTDFNAAVTHMIYHISGYHAASIHINAHSPIGDSATFDQVVITCQ